MSPEADGLKEQAPGSGWTKRATPPRREISSGRVRELMARPIDILDATLRECQNLNKPSPSGQRVGSQHRRQRRHPLVAPYLS